MTTKADQNGVSVLDNLDPEAPRFLELRQCQRVIGRDCVTAQAAGHYRPRKQLPSITNATVHMCIVPAAKARAGNTSCVPALVAEEPELMADVKAPIFRPPST